MLCSSNVDLVMSGISLLCSLIGVSLALVIGTSTAADAQTTALRGARVIDGQALRLTTPQSSSATGASSPSIRPPELQFPVGLRSWPMPAKPSFRASSRTTHMWASSLASRVHPRITAVMPSCDS
jgi:hypothetical protein